MSTSKLTAVTIIQTEERLRQQRETFDQRKRQEARWFTLMLLMGYIAALLLPAIAVACGIVIFGNQNFDTFVTRAASATLFVDVVGVLVTVWKVVFRGDSDTRLEPIT